MVCYLPQIGGNVSTARRPRCLAARAPRRGHHVTSDRTRIAEGIVMHTQTASKQKTIVYSAVISIR